jgi:hypothetical protein
LDRQLSTGKVNNCGLRQERQDYDYVQITAEQLKEEEKLKLEEQGVKWSLSASPAACTRRTSSGGSEQRSGY